MSDRVFNKDAYDAYDAPSKEILKKIIEKNTNFKLDGNIDKEHYKSHDISFSNGKRKILFENETRINFETIANHYDTIHIPYRKLETKCDYYIVWKSDFKKFIVIKKNVFKKHLDKIVKVTCEEGFSEGEKIYTEKFIDIPKEETNGFIVNEDFTIEKLEYNKEVKIDIRKRLKELRNETKL